VLGVDGYNPSIIQYNVPPTGAAANAGECWVQDCGVHVLCCCGEGCVRMQFRRRGILYRDQCSFVCQIAVLVTHKVCTRLRCCASFL
jgi:hypothetical protein